MKLLIQNGEVVDPAQGIHDTLDVLVENGKIAAVGRALCDDADLIFNAAGKLVAPGLVDMHVHLRDPGQTHKEDIITGTAAAAAGGVTGVCCMPNTAPAVDSAETVAYIARRARWARAHVYPCAAITQGLAGLALCDFAALRAAGAVAVSDDGKPVADRALFLEGVRRAAQAGLRVISHCEDLAIINGGIISKGAVSQALGVPGMDRRSEDESTAREIGVARETGLPVHIAHVSTRGAAELIRAAKAQGVPVTAETGPHYFTLTEQELLRRDANWRMNPPLREEADRLAILDALCDGTLDAIATDHAPHSAAEKADFEHAPNGVVGLETSFLAAYTLLVRTGRMTLDKLLRLMSLNPARLLGVPGGSLATGEAADIAVFDLQRDVEVDAASFLSKSRNTPFRGMRFYGPCVLTVCGGKIVYMGENHYTM